MKIFIYDEFGPEDTAMMQALYSRSSASVEEHVKKVRATGSGKFMERYYVGYGHASIADCGSTTVFAEGVSMLAAKAIQDWPLYSGQETSTRYIDMSKQEMIDPLGTTASKQILDRWLEFYVVHQPLVASHLREKYPRQENEEETVYERAIGARVFDTLRAFLPAGITTQLSWHTNLRQAHDKLIWLRRHPLAEIRGIAETIHAGLAQKYAHSFGHRITPEQEKYWRQAMKRYAYFAPSRPPKKLLMRTTLKPGALINYRDILATRPPRTNLPHFLTELGQFTFEFMLDFGSFRDLQRHRNGVCQMPLLTTRFSFHPWYLGELPKTLQLEAKKLISEQKRSISKLKATPFDKQYYLAMGFLVPCRVTYALPATVYVAELRSGRMVHPTMRQVAHGMVRALRQKFPILKLHADLSLDDWDVRRGLQDIKEKK